MPIIYSYPDIGGILSAKDRFIVTKEEEGNQTRSIKASDLAAYVVTLVPGVGTGTTNYLTLWSDGPLGELGDSLIKQQAADEILVEGKLLVDDETEISGEFFGYDGGSFENGLSVSGGLSCDTLSISGASSLEIDTLEVIDSAIIGNPDPTAPKKWEFDTLGNTRIVGGQWEYSQFSGGIVNPRMTVDAQVSMYCSLEMFGNNIEEVNNLTVPYGDATFSNDVTIDGKVALNGLSAYADDAAAGAAGILTGDLYQTNGSGAAPLNVAGIVMVKQ